MTRVTREYSMYTHGYIPTHVPNMYYRGHTRVEQIYLIYTRSVSVVQVVKYDGSNVRSTIS